MTAVSATCAVVIFRVKESCITSLDGFLTLDIDLTGQKRRDVFGRLPNFFLREGGGCTQAIMLFPLRALNVISAFRSIFRYSLTVVYCLSNCRLSSHFIVVSFACVRQ